ncbi:ADP-ribose pyrophosphatase [Trichlorobacter thiogenes]|uniref:GDP-mannose pyrophosphatase n=1 Tax=Trichlorobacter thiogenes TaxID=115783 RepID=A0A1T4JX47_9BACT|nr:NUDIX hydrolase [Trichlorobacter thiogenes]SJZ34595.1 ADP-ribose pyrophosphatase [Trichlorobacter thiogenes]
MPLKPWVTITTEKCAEFKPWFSVVKDTLKLPSSRIVNDYYRIESPDYVLIHAVLPDGKILFERQYKQCLKRFILTAPSGGINADEEPLEAAKRELLEETGYTASVWIQVGAFTVDGTRGICTAHLFYADGLTGTAEPLVNDMEECELVALSREEAFQAINSQKIPLLPDITLLSYVTITFGQLTSCGATK